MREKKRSESSLTTQKLQSYYVRSEVYYYYFLLLYHYYQLACGVGITLIAANHLYLTDLWWAPSVDHQVVMTNHTYLFILVILKYLMGYYYIIIKAIDRVHRIGQKRQVIVTRFLMRNSMDEKILELQKLKLNLTKLTFGVDIITKARRVRDMDRLLGNNQSNKK